MAGSYNHIITDQGNLVSNETFIRKIENLGDAFETVEEMYGMIWFLAHECSGEDAYVDPQIAVEAARQHYEDGLQLARETPNKGKH